MLVNNLLKVDRRLTFLLQIKILNLDKKFVIENICKERMEEETFID